MLGMGSRFLIFLSGVISERTKPFRVFIKQKIEATGWAYVWVFEKEPPSASLKNSYLPVIDECDLLVLVIWDDITEVVESEFQRASKAQVPILVFRVKDDPPNERLRGFMSKVSSEVKWSEYTGDELPSAVETSVISHLIETHRARFFKQTRRQEPGIIPPREPMGLVSRAPESEEEAVLVAARVLPGKLLRAMPYCDQA